MEVQAICVKDAFKMNGINKGMIIFKKDKVYKLYHHDQYHLLIGFSDYTIFNELGEMSFMDNDYFNEHFSKIPINV